MVRVRVGVGLMVSSPQFKVLRPKIVHCLLASASFVSPLVILTTCHTYRLQPSEWGATSFKLIGAYIQGYHNL